jgi:hypothetical protein
MIDHIGNATLPDAGDHQVASLIFLAPESRSYLTSREYIFRWSTQVNRPSLCIILSMYASPPIPTRHCFHLLMGIHYVTNERQVNSSVCFQKAVPCASLVSPQMLKVVRQCKTINHTASKSHRLGKLFVPNLPPPEARLCLTIISAAAAAARRSRCRLRSLRYAAAFGSGRIRKIRKIMSSLGSA